MMLGYQLSLCFCVFVKNYENDEFVVLLLYIDDMHMLIVGENNSTITNLKKASRKSFVMKDMCAVKNYLYEYDYKLFQK